MRGGTSSSFMTDGEIIPFVASPAPPVDDTFDEVMAAL